MLRNRKEIEEKKLLGVNRVADPTKLKPGTFVELANWIPGKRYKIKKKRGVEALVNEVTPMVPALCTGCPEGVLPDVQELVQVCGYDGVTGVWSNGLTNAGQLNFVDNDYTWWGCSSEASGFGSSYDTPTKWKLWEPTAPTGPSCALTDITASKIALPGGRTGDITATQGAQAGRSGHSDEKSYLLSISNLSPSLSGGVTDAVFYFGETSGVSYFTLSDICDSLGPWAKFGDKFWGVSLCTGSDIGRLKVWDANGSGTGGNETTSIGIWNSGVAEVSSPFPDVIDITHILALHANANFLYALCDGAELPNPRIYQVNKTTLAYIQHWEITDTNFQTHILSFFVHDDDLMFLLASNATPSDGTSVYRIATFVPSTSDFLEIDGFSLTVVYPGGSNTSPCVPGFQYANNYFYVSDSGSFGRIGPLVCPGSSGILWENVG